MPCMRSTVHHQPIAASPTSRATSPTRARAAVKAGASPGSLTGVITSSGRPGEPALGEPGLALIFDAEAVDGRAGRLGHGEVRAGRVEHAVEANRLTRLDAERDDVLDLEVDVVSDPDAVAEPVVADFDRCALDAQHLSHERSEPCHRAAELAGEDLRELVGLFVVGAVVDEDAELPVAVGHDLRRVDDRDEVELADVGPLDVSLANLEG